MKKRFAAFMVVMVMIFSLIGCGGAGTSSADAQTAETGSEGKEITVWIEKIFSEDANMQMEARLKQYGEEKGVAVHVEQIGATDFMTKLNAAIEAKQGVPDIISSSTTKVLNYYPNIPCMDVSEVVEEIHKERPFLEASLAGTKIGDVHYYVPFDNSSCLMFVRKDKLAEAGITEMPETWEEVFAAAEKISDPDHDFYGLGMGCGANDDDDENTLRQYCWNMGGYLFDKDGNITANNDVLKACVNHYAELYRAGVIPADATTWDAGGNNGSYLAGRTGIVFNAPTLYNAMRGDEQYKELLENTEVLAPPAGEVNQVYMAFPVGFSIMNTCKDTALASDIIRYLVEKEWYDEYLDSIAPIYAPVFQDEKENPTWTENPVNAQALKYAESATGYYGYPVGTIEGRATAAKHYFTFPVGKLYNQVATETTSLDEGIQSMIRDMEDFQDQVKGEEPQ
ncbi:ABC transporter substrate-binding protein [Lachnoclostridium sp. Marseille-P6806]|uniref:ABC transporter substrate-binding protein n=1 Tax=Lachnoclostridium sp. Marseille-P6806 TaxID=2364793 RepID=UPI00102F2FF3|nr:extracellular solute-binding protein [Lachnoclostridium sp. Marseille-P6806]